MDHRKNAGDNAAAEAVHFEKKVQVMKLKKVAVITFHRAHNFGSVLQTYALQEFIRQIGKEGGTEIDYSVIDLHTRVQENLYNVFKPWNCLQNVVKNILTIPHAKALRIKHRKFTQFVNERFRLTKRYINEEEIKNDPPEADYYISGSDQIWNVRAKDFSSAYFLDFVRKGKKISYAASLGPMMINWADYDAESCASALSEYAAVSVREQGSADNVAAISDVKCDIHVDPTLLLSAAEWRKVQSDANYHDGQYILLYCLEPTKEQLAMAESVSKKLKLPIVVLRYNNKNDMFNHFVKKYDSGPEDFLAYIDHAALVLSSSFHGTAFSLIYHKPFYVFNGMKDNRIASILMKTKMTERSLESVSDTERVTLEAPDVEVIEKLLEEERQKSREYIGALLEIDQAN